MASKSDHTEMCMHLGRMITNKLYGCLEETSDCPYQVIFGNGNFCTCGLYNLLDLSAHKPLRNKEYERDKWDS